MKKRLETLNHEFEHLFSISRKDELPNKVELPNEVKAVALQLVVTVEAFNKVLRSAQILSWCGTLASLEAGDFLFHIVQALYNGAQSLVLVSKEELKKDEK